MAEKTIEQMRETILEKVRQAGAAGLGKAKIGSFKAGSAGARAFAALLREGVLQNLGTAQRARYVTAEFFRPLEIAYQAILEKVGRETLKPWSRAKLETGLTGAIKAKAAAATDLLVEEKQLVPIQVGAGRSYLSVRKFKEWLGEAAEGEEAKTVKVETAQPATRVAAPLAPPAPSLDGLIAHVIEAYRAVRARIGYDDVEILAVREAAGVSQQEIERALLELGARGRAVLSGGDFSLATEAERAAAIELLGRPQLAVRIEV